MADRIDAAEFDRRKAEARAKATAEHAPLTELERASAEYMETVSARTKAEAALSTSNASAPRSSLTACARSSQTSDGGSCPAGTWYRSPIGQIRSLRWSDAARACSPQRA